MTADDLMNMNGWQAVAAAVYFCALALLLKPWRK